MSWLPQMIHHDGVLETFSGLKWWLREFEPEVSPLLLSDLPIHWEGGFHEPGFLIYLPVAPNGLFLGARTEQTKAYLDHLSPGELVRRVNLTTLASSSERIWSSERAAAQLFIEVNRETLGQNVRDFAPLAPWAKKAAKAR